MPRTARFIVADYCYHVLNRSNKKARIFHATADYERFLALIHLAQQWAFATHVRCHHATYGTTGRLWQGRFEAFLIQQDHHLLTVMRHVERNPLRARLVERAEDWRQG